MSINVILKLLLLFKDLVLNLSAPILNVITVHRAGDAIRAMSTTKMLATTDTLGMRLTIRTALAATHRLPPQPPLTVSTTASS